jgi:hypothetical protein
MGGYFYGSEYQDAWRLGLNEYDAEGDARGNAFENKILVTLSRYREIVSPFD